MDNSIKAFLASVAIIAAAALLVIASFAAVPRTPLAHLEVRTAIDALSLVGMALTLFLLYTYMKSYLELRSNFTLGLILFITAIMLFVMTSSRVLLSLLGLGVPAVGLCGQTIDIVPSLFAVGALAILAYLSSK